MRLCEKLEVFAFDVVNIESMSIGQEVEVGNSFRRG
jgi:hypothetical protein